MCLCSALRTESLNFEHHFQPMNYWLSASYTVEPLFQFHMQLQSSLSFAGKYSASFLFSSLQVRTIPEITSIYKTVDRNVSKDEKYKEKPN